MTTGVLPRKFDSATSDPSFAFMGLHRNSFQSEQVLLDASHTCVSCFGPEPYKSQCCLFWLVPAVLLNVLDIAAHVGLCGEMC